MGCHGSVETRTSYAITRAEIQKVDEVLHLKQWQNHRFSACNIQMLLTYEPKKTQLFSMYRLDNSPGRLKMGSEDKQNSSFNVIDVCVDWGPGPVVLIFQGTQLTALDAQARALAQHPRC
ncbi:hypothetical protein CHS0354_037963 [Potamilus streckersoni]|uniref:Uncharacterized protein n=1 Tax=Potamilus streckersoni TaxID=2493646 RepID=A0AAE0W9E2_9BIVA|nr:hypothetical protein CHS0354_037963 [Potamilus streckersoni]